jgi:hypothetical protein
MKRAIARPVTYDEHEAGGLHPRGERYRHDNGKFTSIRDVASTSQPCTTAAIRRRREGITKK